MSEILTAIGEWFIRCPDGIDALGAFAFVGAVIWVAVEEARARGRDRAAGDPGGTGES